MSKIIFITGATGNLGKAVVEKFISPGNTVVVTVSPGKTSPWPSTVSSFETDLSDEKKTEATVAAVIEKYGKIDVALLLVGGYASGGIQETTGDQLRKMYALNFETTWFAARPVFINMQANGGGRIVLIGSRPSLQPADGKKAISYALAKSLLFRVAEIFNAEGASSDVVTSVIVPSTIDTPANRQAMPKADFSHWVKPEEIAEIMGFIVSVGGVLRDGVFKVYGRN